MAHICKTGELAVRKNFGFTIIELMVTIGVLGVLVSITVPALGRVRDRAWELVCLSNCRQISQLVLTYSGEADGRFPSAAADERVIARDPSEWYSFVLQSRFLFGQANWHDWAQIKALGGIYQCVANPLDFDDPVNAAYGPNFGLVSSAYTAPGYFNRKVPNDRWVGRFPGKLRAIHDATFASEKVMIYEVDIYHGWRPPHTDGDGHTLGIYGTNGRGATAMMDGSGRLIGSTQDSAFVVSRFGNWIGGRFNAPEHGIAGRDLQQGHQLEWPAKR